jgi:branched-chain amino acid transport system ATP-binding protein
VIVLDAGRKIAEGPPALIRSDPGVLAAYLGQTRAAAGPILPLPEERAG